jgi:hypothetical protein
MKSNADKSTKVVERMEQLPNKQTQQQQEQPHNASTTLRIGRLQQQIGDMKKDVEELLKQKNGISDKTVLEKINKEKKEKIKVLKRLAKKLRDLYKDTKKERELKNAGSVLDGIAYHKAKREKKGEGLPKVRKIRAAREAARNRYLGYLSMESKYYMLDPQDVPGCLFLHDKIINTYGLLPEEYLRLNTDLIPEQNAESNTEQNAESNTEQNAESNIEQNAESNIEQNAESSVEEKEKDAKVERYMETIKEKRLEWLRSMEDGGKLFFELHDKIFGRKEYQKLVKEKEELEEKIDRTIRESLTESQLEMYDKSFDFIGIWAGSNIKTKKMKERFKLLLHALATLKSETCLPIVEYFKVRYKVDIITNDYEANLTYKNKNVYAIDLLEKMVQELKGVIPT